MLHLSPFVKTMQGLQPNTPRLGARNATKVQVMCLRGPSGDSLEWPLVFLHPIGPTDSSRPTAYYVMQKVPMWPFHRKLRLQPRGSWIIAVALAVPDSQPDTSQTSQTSQATPTTPTTPDRLFRPFSPVGSMARGVHVRPKRVRVPSPPPAKRWFALQPTTTLHAARAESERHPQPEKKNAVLASAEYDRSNWQSRQSRQVSSEERGEHTYIPHRIHHPLFPPVAPTGWNSQHRDGRRGALSE